MSMWVPRWVKKILESVHAESSTIQKAIKKQESAIRDSTKAADEERREIPRIVASAIKTAHEDVPAYEKRQRDKEYRQQNRLITATWFAFGAAAIYAGIAAVQLSAFQKANDIARSSLIAQTRPLLGPDGEPFDKKEVSIGTASNPNRIQVTFNVSINNFGHSPGSRVGFGQLTTMKARGTEIKQICDKADMESRSESSAGSLGNTPTHLPRVVTIFPQNPYKLSVSVPDPDLSFEAVCIAYQAAGDEKTMYHTILVYRARIEVAPPPIPQHIINVSLADTEAQ